MSAREIVAADLAARDLFSKTAADRYAIGILDALTAAGYRLLPPGALDAETVERCAKIADDEDGVFTDYGMDRNNSVAQRTSSRIAAAIRSLSPKDKP